MAAADPARRRALSAIASDISWARTPNRAERTQPARRASPTGIDYWIAKVRADGVVREQDIEAAAQNAHRAHMRQMALKGVEARRRKSENAKSRRSQAA